MQIIILPALAVTGTVIPNTTYTATQNASKLPQTDNRASQHCLFRLGSVDY